MSNEKFVVVLAFQCNEEYEFWRGPESYFGSFSEQEAVDFRKRVVAQFLVIEPLLRVKNGDQDDLESSVALATKGNPDNEFEMTICRLEKQFPASVLNALLNGNLDERS